MSIQATIEATDQSLTELFAAILATPVPDTDLLVSDCVVHESGAGVIVSRVLQMLAANLQVNVFGLGLRATITVNRNPHDYGKLANLLKNTPVVYDSVSGTTIWSCLMPPVVGQRADNDDTRVVSAHATTTHSKVFYTILAAAFDRMTETLVPDPVANNADLVPDVEPVAA